MEHLTACRAVPYAIPTGASTAKTISDLVRPKMASAAERPFHFVAVLVAMLHAFMAVTAVNTKSPTFDEPQHLTAGYSFWVTNDFRLDPENGNLPAMWAALPLLLEDTKLFPLNDGGWQRADEGRTAHQFFNEVGNDPNRMIADARLMMSIFGAALCLLVYRIAREFFGPIGGLIAATLTAFDPNFLAHSALVDSDVPAAFFFTATLWTSWRLLQKITPARLLLTGLSLSGLFLTKFSAPIVLPILGVVSILQIFSATDLKLRVVRFELAMREHWKKALGIATAWFVVFAIVITAIWGSCTFRYSAWANAAPGYEEDAWHWSYVLEKRETLERTISFAREHHLLPEAFLYGFAYVRRNEDARPTFLDNQWSLVGFNSFFPRAFLYKTAPPVLCLLAFVILTAIARRDWRRSSTLLNPFLLFVLTYGAFAVGSQLNIGHRHILPIYPALFIACGSVAYFLQTKQRVIFAAGISALLLWQIGESLVVRPNYLAYFNQIAGGPGRGAEHLVDSSLDWGQDLPALKSWLDNHPAIVGRKPIYLAYFGSADPRSHGIIAKRLPENHASGDQTLAPLRAGLYCISATILQSVYAREIGPWSQSYEDQYQAALAEMERYRATASQPASRMALVANDGAVTWVKKIRIYERLRFERLCAYLRHRSPDAQLGYSIFLFHLSAEEVDRALYAAPAELTHDGAVAGY